MVRRLLINPVTTLLLLAMLLLDARQLSHTRAGYSMVGAFVHRHIGRVELPGQPAAPRWYTTLIVKEPTGLRILDPDVQSWDEATRLLAERPRETAALVYKPRASRSGFWAIATEHREYRIDTDAGSGFSPDDWRAARAAAIRSAVGTDAAAKPDLRRLVNENFETGKPIWSGYAHNTAALLCLVLLFNSLRWIPRTPAYFRARRAARGLCPHCGYSRAGLTTPTCPECGRPIEPRA